MAMTPVSPHDVLSPAVPVFAAPMAGGPSTPALVAAVLRAGGGGVLAGGMRAPEEVRAQVDELRRLLTAGSRGEEHWGVNLFVPDAVNTAVPAGARTAAARARRRDDVAAYRERLAPVAEELGAALPTIEDATPDPDAERDAFEAMLAAAEEQAWPMVTFTFGLPAAEVFGRLAAAGIVAGVTVTSTAEARAAVRNGAAFLVVQGPEAGGHRGTLDPAADPGTTGAVALVAEVSAAVGPGMPLVAAGGVASAAPVRTLLGTGATAVAAGTAFLLTPEAGTSAVHREGLRQAAAGVAFTGDDGAADTAVTRAYTGRWARSLRTPFMAAFPDAPAAYPEVNVLTTGLRAAAAQRGDLGRVHLWAGTGAGRVREADAAAVLASLDPR